MTSPFRALLGALLLLAGAPVHAVAVDAVVDANWLKSNAGAEDLVVVDIQSPKEYARFHVPGAVNLPYEQWRTKGSSKQKQLPSMLPPVERLEAMIGGAGIGNDSQVVIVPTGRSSGDLAAAARVFWTFKVLGHDAVGVLDGGLVAYAEAGGRLANGGGSRPPVTFNANPRPELIPSAEDVRAAVDAGVLPVDARSEGEFVGIYTGDKAERPGTIPGSRNLPYDWLAEDGSGKLRSAGALRSLFEARDVDAEGEQIHFCHSGNRAALTWFAAYAVLGNDKARLYDGSMLEWARRDDLPIETRIELCKSC